ncbi:MAG: MFS transporter, partial [Desulfovibrionaceae bacterium]|nr:MFS transporter [Desulfovibrionaceae bacterium]
MSTSTVLPIFLEEFLNIGGLLLGIVVACYTITTVVCRPFVGYLIDRLGRKIIYLPSYLLFGGLFFFYPFAGALAGMILLRLAHGVFWGANLAAAGTVVVDIVPVERRGEGLGIFGLTACIGMALGPALGVLIISEFGYRTLFIGCGIFLLLFFLISLTVHIPKIPFTQGKFT